MTKLARSIGFSIVAAIGLLFSHLTPASFAEDLSTSFKLDDGGKIQPRIAYDEPCDAPSMAAFDYDPASLHPANKSENRVVGTGWISAQFAEFLAAKGPLRVDPAELRLPPTRAEGADPFKLADQIKKHGTSTEGMPPIQVTRGANGEMMINDGVTRATRGAMTPGTTVPIQVIEENPALNLGNLPKVGERTPGRP